MPPRVVPGEDPSQAMILGEMRGQLREVVHSVNNLSMKVDGLSREVIALGPLAIQIAEIKINVAASDRRVVALEADKLRREGAIGLIEWAGKNYPTLVLGVILILWVGFADGMFK